ncbi:S8 family serine peptidase [Heyndrickxia sp. NPDC080065]|uniref:S8 family serine peptidase n=1 Tax=Heyndrickxia sp. NPDC080065 TaxID=3390568 RepID=UPI003D01C896
MRQFMLLLFFDLLFCPQISLAAKWDIPPLPKPSPNEEVVMIFATNGPPKKSEIDNHIGSYQSIKLRSLFTESFEGFSVSGRRSELTELSRMYHKTSAMYENNEYSVDDDDGAILSLIGAEKARDYYDSKGNHLTGKGIKIGIIDTGIDYEHPDLRTNYSGGYDLIDDDKNPMETLIHQGKPTIHGTHVAGVIAANGQMQGVASEARIYAYRALGPGGKGTTEQILSAIEKTIKDKMDIINLSLGSDVNGPDLPISKALNKVVEKGIVAVTSNGNSGPKLWTVGTPGTSSKAISVGASTPLIKTPYLSAVPINRPIKLIPLVGSVKWNLGQSYPIEYIGLGKKNESKNLNGKIALIKRGEIEFSKKVKNAEAAGAVGVIIFNNTKGQFIGKMEENTNIPAMSISKMDGEKLLQEWKKSPFLTSTIYKREKDLLADFSSRGPVTFNWSIKPDITAPGVAIKSTIPNRRYVELQGTSMASPYIAGAAALIKQAHPKWSPNEIKAAMMNTATPLYNEKGERYKVYEQGAGRINIDKAIKTETLVLPGSLSFGILSEKYDENKKDVMIKNISNQTKHYYFQTPRYNPYIDWQLPLPFALKPGQKRTITIKALIKREFQNNKEMVEGNFILTERNQNIKIPYLFIKEEPSYPRIMGFTIAPGDSPEKIRYEVYLPMGAEEFGIALFDSTSLQFIGYLEKRSNLGPGIKENQIELMNLGHINQVVAVAFAIKNGQEDRQTQTIKFSAK